MYYYNTETKQSSWEKPADLKTTAEVLDIIQHAVRFLSYVRSYSAILSYL